jgi:hypothetical protein
MVAGQTGETQWVKHPDQASSNPVLAALGQGEPVTSDNDPFWGSAADPATVNRQPINPGDNANTHQLNQTYASLPFTFNGADIKTITGFDTMSSTDLADVQADIPAIAALKTKAVPGSKKGTIASRPTVRPYTRATSDITTVLSILATSRITTWCPHTFTGSTTFS